MTPKFSDYTPELLALKRDGYVVEQHIVADYGHSLGVVIRKVGHSLRKMMLRECFYDSNWDGERTKFHGVIDIRQTPWSKNLRGVA